jgi:hypothetical protein
MGIIHALRVNDSGAADRQIAIAENFTVALLSSESAVIKVFWLP